ncbi:MAG: hypothetical protein KAT14_05515 [Candidatus Marinimicrobia bacterium]|nr:hypothetical protein [Candidatus Neomarinimicrobiota bacterium]
MRRNMKTSFSLLVVATFCFVSCFDPPVQDPVVSIEFYFLADSTLTNMDSLEENLYSLELADEPWLIEDDIAFYEWSTHCIYLNKSKRELLPEFYSNMNMVNEIKPFVVTVDSLPVYLACFDDVNHAMLNPFPSISLIEFTCYPNDILSYFYFPMHDPDRRDNIILKNALIENGQYRGGLEIRLDLDYGMHITRSNDSTTIEYKMIFNNLNDDALYVLDPVKTGWDLFLLLNEPPYFTNLANNRCAHSYQDLDENSIPDTLEWGDTRFYTRIPARRSISRTIMVGGYIDFQPDTYYFYQYYRSFPKNMSLENRTKSNGRIWIGWTYLPFYQVTYTGEEVGTLTEFNPASLFEKFIPK